MTRHHRYVVGGITALEVHGLFSGFGNQKKIYIYPQGEIPDAGSVAIDFAFIPEEEYEEKNGIRVSTVRSTISYILKNADIIDDAVIMESLNTYYHDNGRSFEGLNLEPEEQKILNAYKEDAIAYTEY